MVQYHNKENVELHQGRHIRTILLVNKSEVAQISQKLGVYDQISPKCDWSKSTCWKNSTKCFETNSSCLLAADKRCAEPIAKLAAASTYVSTHQRKSREKLLALSSAA